MIWFVLPLTIMLSCMPITMLFTYPKINQLKKANKWNDYIDSKISILPFLFLLIISIPFIWYYYPGKDVAIWGIMFGIGAFGTLMMLICLLAAIPTRNEFPKLKKSTSSL